MIKNKLEAQLVYFYKGGGRKICNFLFLNIYIYTTGKFYFTKGSEDKA